ncbi:MAG: glycosyltransferase family 2 protein [Alphaproteobacteria bacterium]
MKTLVVLPAFNEAATLGRVLDRIRAVTPDLPVVVVDDGSADATGEIARKSGGHVLRLPFNMGVGVALQTAYKYALREGYDCVVQLDSDGQHEPADIPALLDVIERGEADLAVGSRFLGAGEYDPETIRRLGMRLFQLLAVALTGVRFSDVTSGFRALSADVLHFFTAERYPVDYPDADVLMMLTRAGFRIKEVPVRMYPRTEGCSQHAGLRPIYYVFKMLLSVILTVLRHESFKQREA